MPEWVVAGLAGILGLTFGSFASVPAHRWPNGGTVTEPRRSVCPHCDAPISARDNIPVVSWLLLNRRCRSCNTLIPARYPILEATTAVLFAAVVATNGVSWLLPALLVFTWALVVATAIDLEHQIIPNRLTYPLAPVLLVLLILAAASAEAGWAGAASAEAGWGDLRRAVIAGIALPLGMFLLSEAYRLVRGKVGMGMGDVKLAASIGLVVGYLGGFHLIVFAYASVISAVVIALGLVATGRAKLASRIPFGPYLAAGAMLAVLAGDPLAGAIRAYLGL